MKISILPFSILSALFFAFSTQSFSQERIHKIKSGENLSLIAKKYKTSVDELIRLNPDAANGLKAGKDLRLPEEATKEPAKSVASSGKKHLVVNGESLSRIAKKYKVSVSNLEKWNQMKASELKAGQEIIVAESDELPEPKKPVKLAESPKEETESEPSITHQHIVFKGETLSSIAQKEKTTVSEIKKLNKLKNDQVNLGQVLLIPGPDIGVSNISKEPSKVIAAVKTEAPSTKAEPIKESQPAADVQAVAQVKELPVKLEEKPAAGIREINNTLGYTRVVETGFAETIDGDVNSKKHLCLHKTAPIGSILQVKNEVNGQSVFVKVIGKLPDTGSNEKIIIRITRQAYDRLMASGKRFPVEVSYPESQP